VDIVYFKVGSFLKETTSRSLWCRCTPIEQPLRMIRRANSRHLPPKAAGAKTG
jgi:hypothetical protein